MILSSGLSSLIVSWVFRSLLLLVSREPCLSGHSAPRAW